METRQVSSLKYRSPVVGGEEDASHSRTLFLEKFRIRRGSSLAGLADFSFSGFSYNFAFDPSFNLISLSLSRSLSLSHSPPSLSRALVFSSARILLNIRVNNFPWPEHAV